jgi:hypothetical protein
MVCRAYATSAASLNAQAVIAAGAVAAGRRVSV